MKFLVWVGALTVFFVSTGLYAEELRSVVSEKIMTPADVQKFPFLGRVKGKNINVRGGNNLNFEILTQLQDQETVIVLSESPGWYQIDPPQTAFLWINKSYVKEGIVTADSVNVRGSPTLAGTLNCQLARNDAVEVVVEEGEWLKIKPPPQAKAWVSKDYVAYEKPLDQDMEVLKAEKAKALQESRKVKILEAAQVYEEAEFYKPVDQIQVNNILANYQSLLNEFQNDEILKAEIEGRMTAVKLKAKKLLTSGDSAPYIENGPLTLAQSDRTLSQSAPAVQHEDSENIKAETTQTSSKPSEQKSTETTNVPSLSSNTVQSELDDPRLQVFQGKLEWAGGFGRGKKYKLVEYRKRICILMGKEFSLQPFVHQNVKVYGKTVSWIYPRIPVVRVVKVEKV